MKLGQKNPTVGKNINVITTILSAPPPITSLWNSTYPAIVLLDVARDIFHLMWVQVANSCIYGTSTLRVTSFLHLTRRLDSPTSLLAIQGTTKLRMDSLFSTWLFDLVDFDVVIAVCFCMLTCDEWSDLVLFQCIRLRQDHSFPIWYFFEVFILIWGSVVFCCLIARIVVM